MYKEAFNRLPEYFRKTNTEKAYYIGYGSTGDLLQAMEEVKESRDIDKAYGKTLDYIGGNVGQLRTTESDEMYRLLIKTRIIANLANGDIPTINEVSKVLLGENFQGVQEAWTVDEWGNEVSAIIFELTPEFGVLPFDVLERTVAGGVGIKWTIAYSPPGNHINLGAFNQVGEVVNIYPLLPEEPTIKPKLFTGAYIAPGYEEIHIGQLEESNDIKASLDVRNVNNAINQLERLILYSNKGGEAD